MTHKLANRLIDGFSSLPLKPPNVPAMFLDAISVPAAATKCLATLPDAVPAVAGAAGCSCEALAMLLDGCFCCWLEPQNASTTLPDAVSVDA